MKLNNLSIRAALVAVGALFGAFTIPSTAFAVGAVLVNSAPVCASSSATMSLTPAGDIAIVCAAVTPPVCAVSPGSSNVGIGQSVTLTANCNPAATSFAWATNGPAISGQSQSVTFPSAGTFTYSVTGTNANGTGATSTAATVVVTAASVAPTCSVSASPSTITAGGTSTLTAICSPTAASYAWSGSGPAVSGSGGIVTFPTAGTFTYTVTGINNVGPGQSSAATSVVVQAAGSCVPKAVTGAFTANGIRNLAIDRGASVSYQVPAYAFAGRTLEILSIGSTSSQQDLTSEFSVSECPGDFDNMQAECKTWGTVNQSGTQLYATTNATPVIGTCTVILGRPFYINVRNTKYDRVTPACTPQTCYMILQLNSY